MESYDFHGLEVLQAMVESRKGGEKGVKSVQFLKGEELWNAAEQGAGPRAWPPRRWRPNSGPTSRQPWNCEAAFVPGPGSARASC